MKIFMLKMMMMISSMIPFLKNPMSMGIMLLLQTLIMILLMNKMLMSSWFVLITFLMMIGGILILFTYMSSIASNEMFKLNLKMLFIIPFMMMTFDEMMNEKQLMEMENIMKFSQHEMISMIKLYNLKSMLLTMMMVLYLLLTMIVVSMIVKQNKGPLRSKNYE
uniref:NADH dehydrogenase subunit 6 n=1 Tax=Sophonia fuscomarginata TaxID=3092774 RepID=A0AAF0Z283_9HEMI|nr:NADH dehydrogenase subunit 6 [Sophonia fuscomarginata]WPC85270.1 NADH dehydrogenase subunit 6 [Sophonia fuscomarginata]